MHWEKLGRIFNPQGQYDWVQTHGMLPVVDHVDGDIYRIYFSGRDKNNISRIGYVHININDPLKVIELSEKPIVDIGELGCYDDNGISPTAIVNHDGKKYLYIMGWNKGSKVRAAEISGLAISSDGGATFQKYSRVPVLERSDAEPYTILVADCVIIENGVWRMWYDSADYWINESLPRYCIKYAESTDGIHWERKNTVSVGYKCDEETRVSKAAILKDGNIYRMWYCYAMGLGGYNMGYGESKDGIHFTRMDDKVGIKVSESGWDSEMTCYPYIFRHKDDVYMVYCGNGYGRTGFGIAKLVR